MFKPRIKIKLTNINISLQFKTIPAPYPKYPLFSPNPKKSKLNQNPNQIKIPIQCLILIQNNMDNDGSKSSSNNIVDYLLVENKNLKQQIEDLKQMVKMNKVEIDVLSKNNAHKKYVDIIANYRAAHDNNQRKIDLLEKKIQEINSEKLVLEQLTHQSSQELKALQNLHRDRIQSLQKIIKDLERKLSTLDRAQRSYDSLTGFVQRNKEIFNPTEQAIQFRNKQDQMKDQICLLKDEISHGKQNQDNLLKINGILRHKVVTLQAKLAMPNKNLGQILDKSLKRLMMYFIETQKRLLTGEESDSEGQEDLELIAPELATYFGQYNLRRQNTYNVPHLDLLKIRGSVANGNAKIKQQLIKRNHLSDKQKIQRLQIQLQYTRRQLTKNMIDLREEIDKRKMLERICEELETRNQLLTGSNTTMLNKLNKYNRKIKESKEKQLKFVELDDTINQLNTTIKIDNNLRDKPKATPQKQFQQSLQIFDTPEQYKIHLQLLAKDLAKNKKMQNLDHLKRKQMEGETEWKPRIKRSTSNPFLYFNERRQEIMEINNQINQKDGNKMRLEQTEIFGHGGRMGQLQNLDDIDI